MLTVQFNPDRLDIAIRRRGLTKKALAASSGISLRSLARYSNSEIEPHDEVVARLADTLGFPPKFFYGETLDEVSGEGPSFRALSKLTVRQKHQAVAAGALGMHLSDWIESRFGLPDPTIPQYEYADPEAASMDIRSLWGLGVRPISNIIHLLELHGVRIFSLAEDTLSVDAYSFWRDEKPYIFLNTRTSAERSRMDAAHELGHLVLHAKGGAQRNRRAEEDAKKFGASFLMPRRSVIGRVRPGATLHEVIQAKSFWKVSAVSLVFRLRELEMLTSYQYRQLFIELSKRGYRTKEPKPHAEREASQVLEKVLRRLHERGVTTNKIADDLSVYPGELSKLLFGIVRFPVVMDSI